MLTAPIDIPRTYAGGCGVSFIPNQVTAGSQVSKRKTFGTDFPLIQAPSKNESHVDQLELR